mmetsp:Transcript_32159/g.96002  ORF Transcript_32159/g.96002 Transcript_32159/m.96002 type:complete len:86 (-) Transcript_32159:353-610(-)
MPGDFPQSQSPPEGGRDLEREFSVCRSEACLGGAPPAMLEIRSGRSWGDRGRDSVRGEPSPRGSRGAGGVSSLVRGEDVAEARAR